MVCNAPPEEVVQLASTRDQPQNNASHSSQETDRNEMIKKVCLDTRESLRNAGTCNSKGNKAYSGLH